jgi:hypothetical protein
LLVYRKYTGFCMLIFISAILLKVYIRSKSHLVESLESFKYRIISTDRESLISSLPIYVPFISFSCLIPFAKNSVTMLNTKGKNGHLLSHS